MRKIGGISLGTVVLVMFVLLMVTTGYAEEDLCIPMGELPLEPPDGVDQKRSSVDFPHAIHFGYACQQCHHTWAGEADIKSCSAAGCHDQLGTPKDDETGEPDPDRAIQYYKKAYHELCIGCHKDIKEKNKELELSKEKLEAPLMSTGPTGCIKCHPKE